MVSDSDSEVSSLSANAVALDEETVLPVFGIICSVVVLFKNSTRRRWGNDVEIVVTITGTLFFFMTIDKLVGVWRSCRDLRLISVLVLTFWKVIGVSGCRKPSFSRACCGKDRLSIPFDAVSISEGNGKLYG